MLASGQTLTVFDEAGPGDITHIWVTLSSHEPLYLKKLALRMYWDNESTPSVEAPIGDFYGLGLGENIPYQSLPLAVGNSEALNCYFPMPFQKWGKITLTNEGTSEARVYYNIDYRVYKDTLPPGTLYFHAQYRQCAPCQGWTNQWTTNQDFLVDNKTNLTGEENYVWMEATGRGHYLGVTMSVLQNQDKWWGEGDDMFFIDGEKSPSIKGTGSEDYFSGGWDFGRKALPFVFDVRSPGGGPGNGGQQVVGVPIPPRFADHLRQIDSRHHRARQRESPLGQFLFRGLLVSNRAARAIPQTATSCRPPAKNLLRRRSGKCGEVRAKDINGTGESLAGYG